MRKNATWGGNIEIQAMSRMLGVNIVIHQADAPRWEVVNWPKDHGSIHLSYHNGEHYGSVRPLGSYAG
jgi:OTU domain-containing protein 3